MNRSKIEWCDHTWNPITGCNHGCSYCYARTMTARFAGDIRLNKMCTADYSAEKGPTGTKLYVLDKQMLNETGHPLVYPFGFEPTFHRYRFDYPEKLKMGNNIFVGAMSDMFGEWVPSKWLEEIFAECLKHDEHNYMFLTKNPKRYSDQSVDKGYSHFWYGTTITCEADVERINHLPNDNNTYVSVEPILEDINPELHSKLFESLNWIIIGAETGRRKNKTVPKFEWIKKLVLFADSNAIPVFMKDSLIDIVGEKNMRRDFPRPLLEKTISEKMQNKLYEACSKCGSVLRKNQMVALLARGKRGTPAKQYAYLCKGCFEESCRSMGVEIPNIDNLEE